MKYLSEALYIKFNPAGDPFKKEADFDTNDMFLFSLGLGIYWKEGEKVSKHAIRVANSGPYVIKMFVNFLLHICQLNPKKISYSIICFNASNAEDVKNIRQNN